jgi:hypothetical protein
MQVPKLKAGDYQEINYPILWGGRLARPGLGADFPVHPTRKIVCFFIWKSPVLPMLSAGLTVEQIAEALELSVEEVRQARQQQSSDSASSSE